MTYQHGGYGPQGGYDAAPGPDRAGVIASVLTAVFALVIGGSVGFVLTFTHAQLAPWGLIGGLAVVAALLAGFRLVFGSRLIAAAAGIGVLAAASALALPADAGLVLAFTGATGTAGTVWAIGCVVGAVAASVWPEGGRATNKMDQ